MSSHVYFLVRTQTNDKNDKLKIANCNSWMGHKVIKHRSGYKHVEIEMPAVGDHLKEEVCFFLADLHCKVRLASGL